jgi:FkbM family methyltransferase
MPVPDADPLATYDLGELSLLFRPRSFDKLVIREIWKWDEYFLSRLNAPTGGAVVDVGAHIGAFAVKAHALFPGLRVLALEPVLENFQILEQNLSRNGCAHVTALNLALAAESGTVDVYLDAKNTAGHSTVAKSDVRRSVPALSLGDLLAEQGVDRVYLLKIDCEGGEYEILHSQGFAQLASRVENLVLEYHVVAGRTFDALLDCLQGLGFEQVANKAGYMDGQGTSLFRRQQV